MPKIEEALSTLQNAMAEKYPLGCDFGRYEPEIRELMRCCEDAIEDAGRYKKDENGQWWFLKSDNWHVSVKWEEIPAAVRAVLEVTGE